MRVEWVTHPTEAIAIRQVNGEDLPRFEVLLSAILSLSGEVGSLASVEVSKLARLLDLCQKAINLHPRVDINARGFDLGFSLDGNKIQIGDISLEEIDSLFFDHEGYAYKNGQFVVEQRSARLRTLNEVIHPPQLKTPENKDYLPPWSSDNYLDNLFADLAYQFNSAREAHYLFKSLSLQSALNIQRRLSDLSKSQKERHKEDLQDYNQRMMEHADEAKKKEYLEMMYPGMGLYPDE